MKRYVVMILILLASLCSLGGCGNSKSKEVASTGESITFDGTASKLTEWCGYTATHQVDSELSIQYYICEGGPEDCPHNMAGVLPENMSKKKKARYYALYFDTFVYMFYPCGDYWIEGVGSIYTEGRYSKQQIVEYMYNDMVAMTLLDDMETVRFADTVDVDVSSWDFKVRPTEVVISGVLRVKKDDGSVTMTSSRTIGEFSVTTTSTTDYDYYKYKDVLIQIAAGISIEAYIKFLK